MYDNENYKLPLKLRDDYLHQINKKVSTILFIIISSFILAMLNITGIFILPSVFIGIICINIISSPPRFTNVCRGLVVNSSNGKCDCLFHDEYMKTNYVIEPIALNESVSNGDAIYLYDEVRAFSKKSKIYVERKCDMINRPPMTIQTEIYFNDMPYEIQQYCKKQFLPIKSIASFQIGSINKITYQERGYGRDRKRYYLIDFKTKTSSISIKRGLLDGKLYVVGDLFFLVKFIHKKKYVLIPVLPSIGNYDSRGYC